MILIDLSKHQELNGDPKVTQQISFIENLDRAEDAWMVFILEEVKEIFFDFSRGTVRVL